MLAAAGTDGDRPLGANSAVLSHVQRLGAQLDMAAAVGSTKHLGFGSSDPVIEPVLARSEGMAGVGVAAADAAADGTAAAAGVAGGGTTYAATAHVLQMLTASALAAAPPAVSTCRERCAEPRSVLFKTPLITIPPGRGHADLDVMTLVPLWHAGQMCAGHADLDTEACPLTHGPAD